MKLTTSLAFVQIAIFSIVTAAFAQPRPQPPGASPRGLVIRKLPPGMTQQELQQRLAPMLARVNAMLQQQAQQHQRQTKAIFDATANERAAVNAALNKDPRYKMFVEQMKKISLGPGANQAKAQQLRTLAKANQAIFADAIRAVKINHSALHAKLRAIVPGIILTPDFVARFGSELRQNFRLPVPGPQEFVLQPPFSVEESDSDSQGLAANDAVANADAGAGRATSEVTVNGVVGDGSARAKFGEYVNVPVGVKRVEFTITGKSSYSGIAMAAAGVSEASALINLCVSSPAGNFSCEVLNERITALIGGSVEMQRERKADFQVLFDVPQNGGEYFVWGLSTAYAGEGGVWGAANAWARAEIDRITVRYFYQ